MKAHRERKSEWQCKFEAKQREERKREKSLRERVAQLPLPVTSLSLLSCLYGRRLYSCTVPVPGAGRASGCVTWGTTAPWHRRFACAAAERQGGIGHSHAAGCGEPSFTFFKCSVQEDGPLRLRAFAFTGRCGSSRRTPSSNAVSKKSAWLCVYGLCVYGPRGTFEMKISVVAPAEISRCP